MKYYRFKKAQDHYKNGEIIKVEKENKLLKQWLEDGIIEMIKKPIEKK